MALLGNAGGAIGWKPYDDRRQGWVKYNAPPDVFERERQLKTLEMTPGFLRQKSAEYIKNKLDWLRVIIARQGRIPNELWEKMSVEERIKWNRVGGGDVRRNLARARAEFKAWSWFAVTKETQTFEDGENREYIIEFIKWIRGTSALNDNLQKTPWGRKPLWGASIRAFLEEIVVSRRMFEMKLAKLYMDGPPDTIDKAWIYYKYVVCGTKNPAEYHMDEFAMYTNLLNVREYDASMTPGEWQDGKHVEVLKRDMVRLAGFGSDHLKPAEDKRDDVGTQGGIAGAEIGIQQTDRHSLALAPEIGSSENRTYKWEDMSGQQVPAIPETQEPYEPRPHHETEAPRPEEVAVLEAVPAAVEAEARDEAQIRPPDTPQVDLTPLIAQQQETNKLLAALLNRPNAEEFHEQALQGLGASIEERAGEQEAIQERLGEQSAVLDAINKKLEGQLSKEDFDKFKGEMNKRLDNIGLKSKEDKEEVVQAVMGMLEKNDNEHKKRMGEFTKALEGERQVRNQDRQQLDKGYNRMAKQVNQLAQTVGDQAVVNAKLAKAVVLSTKHLDQRLGKIESQLLEEANKSQLSEIKDDIDATKQDIRSLMAYNAFLKPAIKAKKNPEFVKAQKALMARAEEGPKPGLLAEFEGKPEVAPKTAKETGKELESIREEIERLARNREEADKIRTTLAKARLTRSQRAGMEQRLTQLVGEIEEEEKQEAQEKEVKEQEEGVEMEQNKEVIKEEEKEKEKSEKKKKKEEKEKQREKEKAEKKERKKQEALAKEGPGERAAREEKERVEAEKEQKKTEEKEAKAREKQTEVMTEPEEVQAELEKQQQKVIEKQQVEMEEVNVPERAQVFKKSLLERIRLADLDVTQGQAMDTEAAGIVPSVAAVLNDEKKAHAAVKKIVDNDDSTPAELESALYLYRRKFKVMWQEKQRKAAKRTKP